MPRWLRALWREPLAQFAVIAAALFVLVPADSPSAGPAGPLDEGPLRISEAQLQARLREEGGAPTTERRATALDSLVADELLLREARRLGLERKDPETRRRLVALMRQVVQAGGREPSDDELKAWYVTQREALAQPTRFTFEHLYFRAGPHDHARAEAALARLRADAPPAGLGDPHAVSGAPATRTVEQVRRLLGPLVAQGLEAAPLQAWAGPWRSPDGLHLARVLRRSAPEAPPLDQVREVVRHSWQAAQRQARLEAWLSEHRGGAEAVVE